MILITGATGTVGRQVTALLHTEGAEVRAVSRDPTTAGLPGVEVVAADPSRPETVDAALSGVTTLFVNPAAIGGAIDDLLARARDRGVRRVVLLSALALDEPALADHPMSAHHRVIESAVTGSGMDWVVLRPGMFAANTIAEWAAQIHEGDVVRGAYAGASSAPLHEADLAQVAVRALLDVDLNGRHIRMTGPESLTRAEMVATIGGVIGRPLRYQEIPPEAARAAMLAAGVPETAARYMLSIWARSAARPAVVADGVPAVLGRPAATYADWVRDHAAAFVSA